MMPPTGASTDKPYRLEFEDRPEYLYIRIRRDRPQLDIVRAMFREIVGELEKRRPTKILAELEADETLSIADSFFLVAEFPDLGFRRYQIALVDRNPEHKELFQFAEAAANNRGIMTRTFTSIADAEEWLASL